MTPRIGIDVGGVLRRPLWESARWPKVFFPDARESMAKIVQDFGPENVFIVSARNREDQAPTTRWLEDNAFFAQTGFREDNVHYCLSRREKAPICAMLGITHFVDDRMSVLVPMKPYVPYRFLFQGHEDEIAKHPHRLHGLIRVRDWDEAYRAITKTLRGQIK